MVSKAFAIFPIKNAFSSHRIHFILRPWNTNYRGQHLKTLAALLMTVETGLDFRRMDRQFCPCALGYRFLVAVSESEDIRGSCSGMFPNSCIPMAPFPCDRKDEILLLGERWILNLSNTMQHKGIKSFSRQDICYKP